MSPAKRKFYKRPVFIIGVILLAIVLVLSITADRLIDGIVRSNLDRSELNFYGITYLLEVDEISTNIIGRSVVLKDVRFAPLDTAALDLEKDTVQLNITFGKLRLEGLDLMQLIKGDSLDIAEIDLRKALVEVFVNTDYIDPDNLQFIPNVKEMFARNDVGRLIARNATIKVKIREHSVVHRTFMEPMNLEIVHPRSIPRDSGDQLKFTFDHLGLKADKMLFDLDNGYKFESGEFIVNSTDSIIRIVDMDYRPKAGTPRSRSGETRTIDWLLVSASEFEAKGFESLELLHRDGFQASHLLLRDPHISMYQAFYVPDSVQAKKAKRLPGPIMRDLNMRFNIDQVEFNNGLIEYEEVYDTIADPIYFSVKDMKLVLKNFTPRKDVLTNNDLLSVTLDAKMMDSVRVRANMKIPVLAASPHFTVTGHVDSLDLTMFNPILEANRLRFKSGFMHGMDMEFKASEERSKGTMDMEFSDLHIQYLKGKKILPIRLTQHNMLVSFLFNKFVKNNNSKTKKDFRQGIINVQRDPNADFLFYIYESVIAGAISSMTGIDDAMADRFKTEHPGKSKKEQRKEKRRQKKEAKKNT